MKYLINSSKVLNTENIIIKCNGRNHKLNNKFSINDFIIPQKYTLIKWYPSCTIHIKYGKYKDYLDFTLGKIDNSKSDKVFIKMTKNRMKKEGLSPPNYHNFWFDDNKYIVGFHYKGVFDNDRTHKEYNVDQEFEIIFEKEKEYLKTKEVMLKYLFKKGKYYQNINRMKREIK